MATDSIPHKYSRNDREMAKGSQLSFIERVINTKNTLKRKNMGLFDKLLIEEARKLTFATPSLGVT